MDKDDLSNAATKNTVSDVVTKNTVQVKKCRICAISAEKTCAKCMNNLCTDHGSSCQHCDAWFCTWFCHVPHTLHCAGPDEEGCFDAEKNDVLVMRRLFVEDTTGVVATDLMLEPVSAMKTHSQVKYVSGP